MLFHSSSLYVPEEDRWAKALPQETPVDKVFLAEQEGLPREGTTAHLSHNQGSRQPQPSTSHCTKRQIATVSPLKTRKTPMLLKFIYSDCSLS